MLTSFFNNSKPIHFVIVAVYMTAFYCISNFLVWDGEQDLVFVLRKIAGLLAFLLSMVMLHYLAKRNELTKDNAYKILLFATFSALFTDALQNSDVIFANLFVILAMRRLITLKTQRFSIEKIFDAVFWICIASLFSFWTSVFFLLVYFAILIHVPQNYKHWLVPPATFVGVLAIVTAVYLIFFDRFYTYQEWFQASDFDFSNYRNWDVLIPLSILLALVLWAGAYFVGRMQSASVVVKPSMLMIVLYLVAAIVVGFFSPTKDTSENMYYFVPLSVMVANYFDGVPDKWFKEVLLWVFVLLPFVLLFT